VSLTAICSACTPSRFIVPDFSVLPDFRNQSHFRSLFKLCCIRIVMCVYFRSFARGFFILAAGLAAGLFAPFYDPLLALWPAGGEYLLAFPSGQRALACDEKPAGGDPVFFHYCGAGSATGGHDAHGTRSAVGCVVLWRVHFCVLPATSFSFAAADGCGWFIVAVSCFQHFLPVSERRIFHASLVECGRMSASAF
jgi:hypothetical protein